jgi:hypothetical protein
MGTKRRNLCLKMRFLTILLGQNRNNQIQAWCTYVVRSRLRGCWTK